SNSRNLDRQPSRQSFSDGTTVTRLEFRVCRIRDWNQRGVSWRGKRHERADFENLGTDYRPSHDQLFCIRTAQESGHGGRGGRSRDASAPETEEKIGPGPQPGAQPASADRDDIRGTVSDAAISPGESRQVDNFA